MTSLLKRELNGIYPNGRHTGFSESLASLTKEIREMNNWKSFIQNPSGKTLYLTGHSKGGALATGATADYDGKIVTYTFEAARFFTVAGVENNSSKLAEIWRFEYQYDLVPHAPLGEVTYNYLINKRDEMQALEEKSSKTLGEKLELFEIKTMFNFLGKLGLPYNKIESNNFNFHPAGKLAYVDSENKLCLPSNKCKKYDEYSKDYGKRFTESIRENARNAIDIIHPFGFSIDQHSKGYLEFMKNEIK